MGAETEINRVSKILQIVLIILSVLRKGLVGLFTTFGKK